ncbi:hypothetical protein BN7_1634 [Wickerhamomyces ciferrii]|uniref:Uncharacterized protein n=1 Tax=Wickerhamomyces ciferrii (strain ATCC 14091 / BCRC 22168 / CBS 111 / JCM 3599 / NBRC 0793 / NRRL Y-1031 F-60-10) TaxID=1206466 RepID=K0KIW0_WICCF|nr:uncharacterized protein BN7_1634 [Wickerhamomyces ciferrii]CCH42092.1 hypothetical protein BN7_1634 [Wickerhamomyces ciferrii]
MSNSQNPSPAEKEFNNKPTKRFRVKQSLPTLGLSSLQHKKRVRYENSADTILIPGVIYISGYVPAEDPVKTTSEAPSEAPVAVQDLSQVPITPQSSVPVQEISVQEAQDQTPDQIQDQIQASSNTLEETLRQGLLIETSKTTSATNPALFILSLAYVLHCINATTLEHSQN